jgi:hypothetical protein
VVQASVDKELYALLWIAIKFLDRCFELLLLFFVFFFRPENSPVNFCDLSVLPLLEQLFDKRAEGVTGHGQGRLALQVFCLWVCPMLQENCC